MPEEISLPPEDSSPRRHPSFFLIISVLLVLVALIGVIDVVLYYRYAVGSSNSVNSPFIVVEEGIRKILRLQKNCDLELGSVPTDKQMKSCAITSPPASSQGWGPLVNFDPDTGETVIGESKYTFIDGDVRVSFQKFKQCGSLEDYNNWEVEVSSLSVRQFLSVLPIGALLNTNNDHTWIIAKLRTNLTEDCWRGT